MNVRKIIKKTRNISPTNNKDEIVSAKMLINPAIK